MWKEIATDIAERLKKPMYLSGEGLCVYAGELGSAKIQVAHGARVPKRSAVGTTSPQGVCG